MMDEHSLQNDYAPRAVLIVEDSEVDLLLITRQLKKFWPMAKIITATTLALSFEHCQKTNFDLVLLDLNLPDSHGAATVQDFRKFNLGARVVVVTGMDTESISREIKEYGASAILNKSAIMQDNFLNLLMEDVFHIPSISWKN